MHTILMVLQIFFLQHLHKLKPWQPGQQEISLKCCGTLCKIIFYGLLHVKLPLCPWSVGHLIELKGQLLLQIHWAFVRCICSVIYSHASAETRAGLNPFLLRWYWRWQSVWRLQILRKTHGRQTAFYSTLQKMFPHVTCKAPQWSVNNQ